MEDYRITSPQDFEKNTYDRIGGPVLRRSVGKIFDFWFIISLAQSDVLRKFCLHPWAWLGLPHQNKRMGRRGTWGILRNMNFYKSGAGVKIWNHSPRNTDSWTIFWCSNMWHVSPLCLSVNAIGFESKNHVANSFLALEFAISQHRASRFKSFPGAYYPERPHGNGKLKVCNRKNMLKWWMFQLVMLMLVFAGVYFFTSKQSTDSTSTWETSWKSCI